MPSKKRPAQNSARPAQNPRTAAADFSSEELWRGMLQRLSAALPQFAFQSFVKTLRVGAPPAGAQPALVLYAPNKFHLERLRKFAKAIRGAAAAEYGGALEVRMEAAQAASAVAQKAAAQKTAAQKAAVQKTAVQNSATAAAAAAAPRMAAAGGGAAAQPGPVFYSTFGTFAVGRANRFARNAAHEVAYGRQRAANPLVLVGGTGLGKTHLARAMVHAAKRRGLARARFCTAENFTVELTEAIRRRETARFRGKFRNECRLLVVDDLQFLEGKKATQQELFHTIEHLKQVGGRVALTADRAPCEIPRLEGRLVSQLSGGLIADIEAPARALRRDILRVKAAHGGLHVPEECIELIAQRVRGNVRSLEGALVQLVSTAHLLGRRMDLELAEQSLQKVAPRSARRLSLKQVADCVCKYFGVTPALLASKSKRREVLHPRQLAMYLCNAATDASASEIARAFGRRHPSVLNAIKKVEREILEIPKRRYEVEEIIARLHARRN